MNMMRGTKMPYKLKQTCTLQLFDYLYMYDLLLPIDIEELKAKNVLKIKCNDKGYSIFNLFCDFTYKARNTALMFEIFAYKTRNTALMFDIFHTQSNAYLKASLALCIYQLSFYKRRI